MGWKGILALVVAAALVVIIAVIMVVGAGIRSARSDEAMRDWFKSLKQPGTGYGCCDLSDCLSTKATQVGGQWLALDPKGQWRRIPDAIIIRDKVEPSGRAILCSGYAAGVLSAQTSDGLKPYLYCFVRPYNGG